MGTVNEDDVQRMSKPVVRNRPLAGPFDEFNGSLVEERRPLGRRQCAFVIGINGEYYVMEAQMGEKQC